MSGDDLPFRFIAGTPAAIALLARAAARIAVSDALRSVYEAAGSGPCDVIYNGIGARQQLAGRRPRTARREPLRMILPGRVHLEKGQVSAIEATAILAAAGHDVELRILGDGDLSPCEEAIDRLRLGSIVTLAGFVADLDREYRAADIALSCTLLEGMGRATAEAMSYGLPFVGCDSLGTAELVRHGITGLLCDGSPRAIARKVERLIARPDEARRMGLRARAFAGRRFSDERVLRGACACSAASCRIRRHRPPACRRVMLHAAGARAPLP